MNEYNAPFPYFGGKSKIAPEVWQRLGADVPNYVEPFAGSIAMLLKRPGFATDATWTETINDADGLVANFWRALKSDSEQVAFHADNPVNENDLHARHGWLVGQKDGLQSRMEGDPEFYDPKIAGWWVWGVCCWIGSGFCSGNGPWQQVDGQLVHLGNNGMGINRQLVHLGNNGRGINRQLVHLGNNGMGINRQRVHLGNGMGINRQLVHLGNNGMGGDAGTGEQGLYAWMEALAERLRRVRVASGDWSRVCGPTPTVKLGTTAVFLDPPYSAEAMRNNELYRVEDDNVAHDVREWAIENGDDPRFRIALCGYDSEHGEHMPDGWETIAWKAHGGYGLQGNGSGRDNAMREVIWFSPHCLKPENNHQMNLFEAVLA